ncbi:hypothetical protein ABT095_00385 [Kitasatospora sp. NPDC002227]|uniref:hypothetical protein n=1 Tax=Kitasatospora sp. NPDC002227 TaxID=3154773 RepID=UPI0033297408
MSTTTRHLINRQRRLAAARPTAAAAGPTAAAAGPAAAVAVLAPEAPPLVEETPPKERRRPVLLALIALLTVLLGGFSALAAGRASDLRAGGAAHNAALADPARTSEVKGAVAQAVNALFSYNYADTARTDSAAKTLLTGAAVQQYASMLAQVHQQAPQQKLVLTTTVTDSGVVRLDGDCARLLVFADQRNTSTAAAAGSKDSKDSSSYAAAMFAVDVIRQGGTWRITNIDTFNG